MQSPSLSAHSDKSRDAVLTAVADVGGSENTRWLLSLVRGDGETSARQRKALDAAARAGASIADMVKLYDETSDFAIKDALVQIYARSGERVAIDKLLTIVKNDTNPNLRRRAISSLSTSDDPRVKEALKGLIMG
jgi:HEAT repeat protein